MVTTRRSRVACCLYPGFDTLDVAVFSAVLARAGQHWNHRAFELVLAGPLAGAIAGEPLSLVAEAQLSLLGKLDVLFVPGGGGATAACRDTGFVEALGRLSGTVEKLCAAGRGQLLLAAAGALPRAAVCADEPLLGELAQLLGPTEPYRELHLEGSCWVAAKSLLVAKLALELVRHTLGGAEAERVASSLGQPRHDVLVRLKN